ncbi:MAG: hypothetical protein RMJ82_01155 [Gemmatales bacterium]|nr:hypothetical protein [Gemmatales bacterium]
MPRLPFRFRQWVRRHICLHDAHVTGPMCYESLRLDSILFQFRSDGEIRAVNPHLSVRLHIFKEEEPWDNELYILAEHPGRALGILGYLGIRHYQLTRRPQCKRKPSGKKLWFYDEVDITRRDDRDWAVHRILFSDGTVAETVFKDFHCFEARFL